MENEDIASKLATDLDLALGTFCSNPYCLHSFEEHWIGSITGTTRCYGFDYRKGMWQSCDCKKFVNEFRIETKIYELSSEETKSTSNSKTKVESNLFTRKI